MIARISTLNVPPDKLDEVTRVAEKAFAELDMGNADGYLGYLGLVDRQASKYVSVYLWEDEAKLAQLMARPEFRAALGGLLPLLTQPPATEMLEVAIRK